MISFFPYCTVPGFSQFGKSLVGHGDTAQDHNGGAFLVGYDNNSLEVIEAGHPQGVYGSKRSIVCLDVCFPYEI